MATMAEWSIRGDPNGRVCKRVVAVAGHRIWRFEDLM